MNYRYNYDKILKTIKIQILKKKGKMKQSIDKFLIKILNGIGISDGYTAYVIDVIYAIIAVIISIGFYFLITFLLFATIKAISKKSKRSFLKELSASKAFTRFLKIIPALFLYRLTYLTPQLKEAYELLLYVYIAVMAFSLLSAILDAVHNFYVKYYKYASQKPIKGLLTVIKLVAFFIALIIILAKILGKSPAYILTGLGALSAVTMLIFKDSILGFVAGFQMSANDLVRIGDWIEMPKYGADGDVIDISLTFVKVRNWDKTIVTIPAYALVSDSFKNWRGMFASGGRRIKRTINIDVSSVSFCTKDQLEKLSKIQLITEYLSTRQAEIDEHNAKFNIDTSVPVNGRHLTNLGIFRVYVTEYLKNHPKIHKDMLLLVRQLQNENTGIPLEIYAFTNDTKWVNYETIMSDIFDHLYSAIGYFGLRAFQEPSGHDIKELKSFISLNE